MRSNPAVRFFKNFVGSSCWTEAYFLHESPYYVHISSGSRNKHVRRIFFDVKNCVLHVKAELFYFVLGHTVSNVSFFLYFSLNAINLGQQLLRLDLLCWLTDSGTGRKKEDLFRDSAVDTSRLPVSVCRVLCPFKNNSNKWSQADSEATKLHKLSRASFSSHLLPGTMLLLGFALRFSLCTNVWLDVLFDGLLVPQNEYVCIFLKKILHYRRINRKLGPTLPLMRWAAGSDHAESEQRLAAKWCRSRLRVIESMSAATRAVERSRSPAADVTFPLLLLNLINYGSEQKPRERGDRKPTTLSEPWGDCE